MVDQPRHRRRRGSAGSAPARSPMRCPRMTPTAPRCVSRRAPNCVARHGEGKRRTSLCSLQNYAGCAAIQATTLHSRSESPPWRSNRGSAGHQLDASRFAAEAMALLVSVEDPTLSIGAASASASIRLETGHAADVLRWAEHIIQHGHRRSGQSAASTLGSPLVALALIFRGIARWWLGFEGWRQDVDGAAAMAAHTGPITRRRCCLLEVLRRSTSWRASCRRLPRSASSRRRCSLRRRSGEDTLVGNL